MNKHRLNPCSMEGLSMVALGLRFGNVQPKFLKEAADSTAWACQHIQELEERLGLKCKQPDLGIEED